jgi:hypothetical protein
LVGGSADPSPQAAPGQWRIELRRFPLLHRGHAVLALVDPTGDTVGELNGMAKSRNADTDDPDKMMPMGIDGSRLVVTENTRLLVMLNRSLWLRQDPTTTSCVTGGRAGYAQDGKSRPRTTTTKVMILRSNSSVAAVKFRTATPLLTHWAARWTSTSIPLFVGLGRNDGSRVGETISSTPTINATWRPRRSPFPMPHRGHATVDL